MATTACAMLILFSTAGCGEQKAISLEQAYDVYETSEKYGLTASVAGDSSADLAFFSKELCVAADENTQEDASISSSVASNIGVFSVTDSEVLFSKDIYQKIYPASTTKILTAYLAIKYGNLADVITISETAVDLPGDASDCGIKAGEQLTLEQLLYGLMLRSGNDAAIAIAEYISGDVASFADLMNQEAVALGATGTHFVNPNGLHDDNHYTTAYDLYLMFNAALSQDEFVKIIHTPTYTAEYTGADGATVTSVWSTTNRYLLGTATIPDGVTIIGGKTGTTDAAGHCDVLYSQGSDGEYRISVVLNADSTDNMYLLLSQLITKTSK